MDKEESKVASTPLEAAIFRTVSFFHVFGWPLTVFEIWKFLHQPPEQGRDLFDVERVLRESLWLRERLDFYGPFVGIGDVAGQVATREVRFRDALRKHRKMHRIAWWMRRVPGMKGLAICNSLAWHATTEKSDIDLFIATHAKRVWTTRFFAALPLAAARRRPGESEDPVCLSFFVSPSRYNLSQLSLEHDPYLLYWCATLSPLTRGVWFDEFVHCNAWVWHHLPNARPVVRAPFFRHQPSRHLACLPLPFAEVFTRVVQLWRLPRLLKGKMNVDSSVIVRNDMLKFHDNDRRREYAARWHELLREYGV